MVNLGDKVKDIVSGFTGIVISKHLYLNGCARLGIQPPVNNDGELPEAETFDEPQLDIIERLAVTVNRGETKKETGGPERYMPKPR